MTASVDHSPTDASPPALTDGGATQPVDDGAEDGRPSSPPWLQRAVGAVILAVAVAASTVLWLILAVDVPISEETPTVRTLLGLWDVLYDSDMPQPSLMVAAVALALLLAAGVAMVEQRIVNRSRRSTDLRTDPLAPKNVMARTRGVWLGPVTVTVLIPAHNEEASLPATLSSLRRQSHRPERIVVVADNCTDRTVAIASAAGVEVVETVANLKKKAGGLNQALAWVLPGQGENDLVMIMDADTQLDDGFLEAAVRRMADDRALMAVGGLFHGEAGGGLIGQFQRNEYIRYSRELRRRRGKVFVLTGTASLFRPAALRAVAAQRGRSLPGVRGDVYDTAALTEDNELTMALKSLGALMISPPQCTVVTEVMPTWRTLWHQRLRWQRGAVENLGAYGITPKTFRYWAQQLGIGYGVIALTVYVTLTAVVIASSDLWVLSPFWLGMGALFTLERLVTVWHGGWRARLLAVLLIPELVYDAFLDVVFVKGVLDISLRRQATWKHLQRPLRQEGIPA